MTNNSMGNFTNCKQCGGPCYVNESVKKQLCFRCRG